jgi:hypothetical protein
MPQLTLTEDDARQVDSIDQLCDLLRATFAATPTELPPIVSVNGLHSRQLDIGAADGEAFVHVTLEGGDGPYMITLGSPKRQGILDLLLHGQHHTQIESRHLIPFEDALDAVREFWRTGELSSSVKWEGV